MENRISKLKTDFNNITTTRSNVKNIFDILQTKIHKLKSMYYEFINNSKTQLFVFCFDSFHFQNKLIHLESENMKHMFNFIDNRIYCEYYKLHRMLYDFINKEIKEKTIVDKLLILYKKYPIYKDLEPTKIYDFNITVEINNAIHQAIQELKGYLAEQKEELNAKKKRTEMGINIHSIIHEQLYNTIILEERIHMFENYLHTFISHHSKYFGRLTIKSKLMLGMVNEDFHLNKKKSTKVPQIDLTDSVSDTSSISSTPKTVMTEQEENHMRLLVGDTGSHVLTELDTILQHIPDVSDGVVCERRITKIYMDI